MKSSLFLAGAIFMIGLASSLPVSAQGPKLVFSQKSTFPDINKSGSKVFDKLRNEAIRKKLPLIIYVTGSSWCSKCNEFTKNYIKTSEFAAGEGKKFIFWLIDSKQVAGERAGTFTLEYIPADASEIVGDLNNKSVPYSFIGPPIVLIIDPETCTLVESVFTKSEMERYGKPLPVVIEDIWHRYREKTPFIKK